MDEVCWQDEVRCLSIPLLPPCDLSWPHSIKSDIHVVVLLVARKQAAAYRKKRFCYCAFPHPPPPSVLLGEKC